MKKLYLLILPAMMLAVSACSQQAGNPVVEELTPEEQAKYDHYVALATEAGWEVVENPTIEDKRKFIETDPKVFEELITILDSDKTAATD